SIASGSGSINATSGDYTPSLAGSTTIRATAGAKNATTSILVTVGALHHLAWNASPSTTNADASVSFLAAAFDAHGNVRSDPISYSVYSGSGTIGAANGLYAPNLVGNATIRASAGALTLDATIVVTPGALHHVTFASAPTATDADTPVTFAAQARDAHDNARPDAIAYAIFSGSGSVSAAGLYTPSLAGGATIRASAGSVHADASITVSPGPLHHVAFTLAPTSTDADHAVTFHAVAYDDKGNARGDPIAYSLDA